MAHTQRFDAIVVGGGPAGSAMGWALATHGIKVAVVEKAVFPREKVCGDFVEPAGLRILEQRGCIPALDLAKRLPITRNRVYYEARLPYHGEIPYYDGAHGMPPHGYIIPRDQLDTVLLQNAEDAGATVFRGTAAEALEREGDSNLLFARQGKEELRLEAPVVVGADGVQSLVAKTKGLRRTDRRHIGASQRVYLDNLDIEEGEATIWFDEDQIPGYGWMFPMTGGRANMGIGLLTETCDRSGLSVQQCFRDAVERLRYRHPGCRNARIASKPLGGAVHMYGGVTRNHFAGGILIGDAGSFVDPMTGEGITQGMESAILGAHSVALALEAGRFDEAQFASFERDFRAYFDPAMRYLVLLAQMLRNRHFHESMFIGTRKGFERAQVQRSFGEISGTSFGGLNVQPLAMTGQLLWSLAEHFVRGGATAFVDAIGGRGFTANGAVEDLLAWQRGWRASTSHDLAWHMAWLGDIVSAMGKLGPSFLMDENPRLRGPFAFLEART
jgi:geranylgeranyl reductase family protein